MCYCLCNFIWYSCFYTAYIEIKCCKENKVAWITGIKCEMYYTSVMNLMICTFIVYIIYILFFILHTETKLVEPKNLHSFFLRKIYETFSDLIKTHVAHAVKSLVHIALLHCWSSVQLRARLSFIVIARYIISC